MDNPEETYQVRMLDPADVRLFRSGPEDARVRLTLAGERSWLNVTISRAFPFSNPSRYIGVQDTDGGDVGMIVDEQLLDAESRALVADELSRRYFTPTVQQVTYVKEKGTTVNWQVVTDRGPREFVVRHLRDSSYPLGANRVMITDVDGNRYHFPDINALGRKAYDVLAKVM